MFIAEIVKVHVSENLFDEDGRIRLDGAGMLAYCHGEYFGLKKHPIGKFGFSVMKPKTRKRLEKQRREKAVSGRHRKTRRGDGRENRSPEKSRKKSKTER